MKLPGKVTIGGQEWTIKEEPKKRGAWFKNNIIGIGVKDEHDILDCFVHEILECILMMRGHRYVRYKDDFMFMFNHHELSCIGQDLALALKDVIKQ